MECQKVRNPESRNMRKLPRSDKFELILFEVFNKITVGFKFLKEKRQKLQASGKSPSSSPRKYCCHSPFGTVFIRLGVCADRVSVNVRGLSKREDAMIE